MFQAPIPAAEIACLADRDDDGDEIITAADFDPDDFVTLADGVRSFADRQLHWDFKPSSINSGVQQTSDNEHLYFGIWVLEPNVASEMHAYEFIGGGETSALTNNMPAADMPLGNFNLLTGTAEFTGGAIGKFVTRNQVGENARIGTFNATAAFTADFATATAAGTLEGRITNFRSPGQALEGEWYLYLGNIDTTNDLTTEAPTAFGNGTVDGRGWECPSRRGNRRCAGHRNVGCHTVRLG